MIDFKPINELMEKKMTRTEFLKHLGAMLVAMVGIGAFIRNVSNPLKHPKPAPVAPQKVTSGYGGSPRPYGM